MGVYEELGVKRLINAWGPMTIVGGSRMRPEVVSAMSEASEAFVDLPELQARAGARIAELIGVEGCYIAGGCAAGLAIATAACVAGTDRARVFQLPGHDRPQERGRDRALPPQHLRRRLPPGRRRRWSRSATRAASSDWELEKAIGPNTAAVAYVYARWTFDRRSRWPRRSGSRTRAACRSSSTARPRCRRSRTCAA